MTAEIKALILISTMALPLFVYAMYLCRKLWRGHY